MVVVVFRCLGQRKQEQGTLEEADVLEEGWEYLEDGPAEILWQGNVILVIGKEGEESKK